MFRLRFSGFVRDIAKAKSSKFEIKIQEVKTFKLVRSLVGVGNFFYYPISSSYTRSTLINLSVIRYSLGWLWR